MLDVWQAACAGETLARRRRCSPYLFETTKAWSATPPTGPWTLTVERFCFCLFFVLLSWKQRGWGGDRGWRCGSSFASFLCLDLFVGGYISTQFVVFVLLLLKMLLEGVCQRIVTVASQLRLRVLLSVPWSRSCIDRCCSFVLTNESNSLAVSKSSRTVCRFIARGPGQLLIEPTTVTRF